MRTHVALLRGINVSGHNKIAMADLRDIVESLGHGNVATYIQSGNVVFTAPDAGVDDATRAEDLENAIADRLGLRPRVIVRARHEIVAVVRDNPFRDVVDYKLLHAVFLREECGPDALASVEGALGRSHDKGSRDDARVVARTLYLWTPDGFATSILRAELDRGGQYRTPMKEGTARNWKTVNVVLSLLEANDGDPVLS
jgi:uncharacterized protein (DUF1697 family)